MNDSRLIGRTLWFYRKAWISLMAGIILCTGILTGALIVGDSVRGSLADLARLRLGKTRWAIRPGNHFLRAALAAELASEIKTPVIPALLRDGVGVNVINGLRTGSLNVIGIDSGFTTLWDDIVPLPGSDEAVISRNLAEKLALRTGDPLLVRIPNTGSAPQNAPFVSESAPTVSWRLTVSAITDDRRMGRFSLRNDQKAPLNIFVSLPQMAGRLEINGLANLLLVAAPEGEDLTVEEIYRALSRKWQPADAGICIRPLGRDILQVTSTRIFFDQATARAVRQAYPDAKGILAYLANNLSAQGKNTPYSFVAAVDSGFAGFKLRHGEALINSWLADDLGAATGDTLTCSYYVTGPLRNLREQRSSFRICGVIPLLGIPNGRDMMPDFPGMSGAGNCRDWETGAPISLSRIRDKDEAYWKRHRGTPKAFIPLEDGQELWNDPGENISFATVTEFRLEREQEKTEEIGKTIMRWLDPEKAGITCIPVYREAMTAADGATDFGTLFLSLSIFLIFSSLLLSSLLFSIHTRARLPEAAILAAIGFRKHRILRIFFTEAILVLLVGILPGTLIAVLFDKLILSLLNTLWQEAVRTTLLEVHIRTATLFTGALVTLFISAGILLLVLVRNLRKPLTSGLREEPLPAVSGAQNRKRAFFFTGILLLAGSGIPTGWLAAGSHTTEAGWFLGAGAMILTAALLLINSFLIPGKPGHSAHTPGLFRLAWRNAGRRRARTMAAISLLAVGTFSILITGANRKTFYGAELDRKSGTGGFQFWAESTVPLLVDLNSAFGKKQSGMEDEPVFTGVHFYQLLRVDGNDASCLNLNRVNNPFLLGVPGRSWDSLNPFRFAALNAGIDPGHPWSALETLPSPGIIPAFADQTVIAWGLQKAVGDTLTFRDEAGNPFKVLLAGGLDNSVFQGHLLVSARELRRLFPSLAGTNVMLVDVPAGDKEEVGKKLEQLFTDSGMEVTPTSLRLMEFNSVENTYLSVFMMLGALGVLIGTIGLGVIFIRNLLDRQPELAIYRALGFRKKAIVRILMTEHLVIMVAGMACGILAALAGVLPSLLSTAYSLPGNFLLILLGVIFLNGLCWIIIPGMILLKQNLTQALRNE